MEDLRIVLNSNTNEFFANSEVHGTVYFESNKPVKAKTITVLIYGRAKTSISYHTDLSTTIYSSTLPCLQKEEILWISEDGSNKLPAGCYQFPFNFFIPIDAPPNISFFNGDIVYYIKAIMDVPYGYNRCYFLGFSVLPYIDLNSDSRLATSVNTFVEKKGIKVTVKLPKVGYIFGETIPLNFLTENKSKSKIKSIEYGIKAITTNIAKSTLNSNNEGINEATKKKSENRTWKKTAENSQTCCVTKVPFEIANNQISELDQKIIIPSLPPSFEHHELIKLKYAVVVIIRTSSVFSTGPSVMIPIVIGTVSIQQENAAEICSLDNEALHYFQPPHPTIPPPDLQKNYFSDQRMQPIKQNEIKYAYFHGWYKTGSPLKALGTDALEIYQYGKPAAVLTGRMNKFLFGSK